MFSKEQLWADLVKLLRDARVGDWPNSTACRAAAELLAALKPFALANAEDSESDG